MIAPHSLRRCLRSELNTDRRCGYPIILFDGRIQHGSAANRVSPKGWTAGHRHSSSCTPSPHFVYCRSGVALFAVPLGSVFPRAEVLRIRFRLSVGNRLRFWRRLNAAIVVTLFFCAAYLLYWAIAVGMIRYAIAPLAILICIHGLASSRVCERRLARREVGGIRLLLLRSVLQLLWHRDQ